LHYLNGNRKPLDQMRALGLKQPVIVATTNAHSPTFLLGHSNQPIAREFVAIVVRRQRKAEGMDVFISLRKSPDQDIGN
jgi:hypothetical protein